MTSSLQSLQSKAIENPLLNLSPITGRVISQWNVHDKNVYLIRNEDRLITRVEDRITKVVTEDPIQVDGCPVEQLQNYLLHCDPIINSAGKVDFTKPLHQWHVNGNKVITLLQAPGSLVWQIFDRVQRQTFHCTASQHSAQPLAERIALLKGLNAEDIFRDFWVPSVIDPETHIPQNQGAITLVSTGQDWYGHAVIVIESMDEGIPYCWFTHLRGACSAGTTRSEVVLEKIKRYKIVSQTETWLRPKEKIKELIQSVEWQMAKEREGNPWIFFNLIGGDSSLVGRVKVATLKGSAEIKALMQSIPPWENPKSFYWQRLMAIGEKKTEFFMGNSHWLQLRDQNLGTKREDKHVEIWAQPDNCITWARRLLTLVSIYLKSNSIVYTTAVEYTQSQPSRQGAGKGQEVFAMPFVFGPTHCFLDFTDEVQRQVGPHAWTLTEESRGWMNAYAEGLTPLATLFLPAFYSPILEGHNRLTIKVEVEGREQEIDLSEDLKRKVLPAIKTLERKATTHEELRRLSTKPFFEMLWGTLKAAWNDAWEEAEEKAQQRYGK